MAKKKKMSPYDKLIAKQMRELRATKGKGWMPGGKQ